MGKITIKTAPETEQYAPHIKFFVDLMLHKLKKNAHKGKWENIGTIDAYNAMLVEVKELKAAMRDGNAAEIIMEAADVANFAMILASIVTERGK